MTSHFYANLFILENFTSDFTLPAVFLHMEAKLHQTSDTSLNWKINSNDHQHEHVKSDRKLMKLLTTKRLVGLKEMIEMPTPHPFLMYYAGHIARSLEEWLAPKTISGPQYSLFRL